MNIKELNKNQLTELKQRYYTEKNESVSYGELANIDNLVSDKEVFEYYDNIDFVEEDFFNNDLDKTQKSKCLELVIEQVANMLYNNKQELGGIGESFEGWCESGCVFYNIENLNNTEVEQCKNYMYRISNLVDNLSAELQAITEEIEKN